MAHVIPAAPVPVVPVKGGGEFPVHRIYCVGRNYVEHAQEMGHTGREPPFFFTKPADTVVYVPEGETGRVDYPSLTKNFHHEIELVVAIGKGGRDIKASDAVAFIWGYGVGLDMTRRDLQGKAKDTGRPWEVGKAFEASAPCTAIVPAAKIGHPTSGAVTLDINGERRQTGDLNQMIWKVPEMISYLSGLFTLAAGDIIFAGTPSGVGPVKRGDKLVGRVEGVGTLELRVV
jgi:fumarylpyruvate hydrolase